MKNYIFGFISAVFLFVAGIAFSDPVIDQVAQYFGPRLLAATALVTLDQVNVLRIKAGLSTVTTNQMLQAIGNKYQTIPPCSWETNSVGL